MVVHLRKPNYIYITDLPYRENSAAGSNEKVNLENWIQESSPAENKEVACQTYYNKSM